MTEKEIRKYPKMFTVRSLEKLSYEYVMKVLCENFGENSEAKPSERSRPSEINVFSNAQTIAKFIHWLKAKEKQ
jgi:hypothetical protein